jgi:DNA-binding NtrC family response regulator
MDPSVLILDQNSAPCAERKCSSLAGLLQRSHSVMVCRQPGALQATPPIPAPDIILLRSSADRLEHGLVASCKKKWRRAPVVALLCPASDRSLDVLPPVLADIDDFLVCPFRENDLVLRIKRLLQTTKSETEPQAFTTMPLRPNANSIIGESAALLGAIEKIPPLARARAPVLILGETGTGKELFARALHYQGPRHGKPFIPVNCGALPDHLFENEFFGHVKGAFTDAVSSQNGLIMEAEGGTLFLDEVATLSQSAQTKLLRFLQDGECRLLGSTRSTKTDVRIVAATNADLKTKVEEKLFREDLYHRLNVLSLTIPALRERTDDIPRLAAYFLERHCREQGQPIARFSARAMEKLMSYAWPGNVRELEGVIQRVVVLHPLPVIGPEDIDIDSPRFGANTSTNTLREAKSLAVGGFERNYLVALLSSHAGNVSRAALAAGKDRRTLQRLLRKYGLDRRGFAHKINDGRS